MAERVYPGTITREQTIWCWFTRSYGSPQAELVDKHRPVGNRCEQHHTEAGPVAKLAREMGWKRIGRYGYTCPACQRAMGNVPGGAWLTT